MRNGNHAAAIAYVREQPPGILEDPMIVRHNSIDEIARQIDIRLCDACGMLRMKGPDDDMDELPRDVVAALISQVRQDIGRLTAEHRQGFETLDGRLNSLSEAVQHIQLDRERAAGKSDGIRMVLGVIITLSTLLGGLVAWIIAHIPWTGGSGR